ncbi:hypothetical protein LS48_14780, partial [Aequorivita aquimaris]
MRGRDGGTGNDRGDRGGSGYGVSLADRFAQPADRAAEAGGHGARRCRRDAAGAGGNLALVGDELIRFALAEPLG